VEACGMAWSANWEKMGDLSLHRRESPKHLCIVSLEEDGHSKGQGSLL